MNAPEVDVELASERYRQRWPDPGDLVDESKLARTLEARGWSERDLARALGLHSVHGLNCRLAYGSGGLRAEIETAPGLELGALRMGEP